MLLSWDMKFLLSLFLGLLVVLLGAVTGAVAGFFFIIGIGLATGDTGREGGLAMGAAMGGAPLGAIFGALLALVAILRWHRTPPDQAFLSPRALALVIAVPVLVALGLSARIWAITTPEFRSPRPEFILELRVARGAIDPDQTEWKPLWPRYHRAGTYVGPFSLLEERRDEDYDYALLRFVMVYRVEERAISLELKKDTYAYFPLTIGRTPVPTETFTEWQAPAYTSFEPWREDPVLSEPPEIDMAIRYKVRWDGH